MTPADTSRKKRVAVMISGRGSNMKALVEAAEHSEYPAEIVMVVANQPDAPGLAWAKQRGLATLGLDHTHFESRAHFEGQLTRVFQAGTIDLIALAGFMRLLTDDFVTTWRDKLINIHPSLLPAFKGLDTHRRALEAGVKVAGCTVHFVRTEMDVGPIIAQAGVPVLPDDSPDTLAARVLDAEHKLYPHALALVASGRAVIQNETVSIDGKVNQPATLFSPPIS